MAHLTTPAENRSGLMSGQMCLREVEAVCQRARNLGCGDDAVLTTTNEPRMDAAGGPIVSMSFEVP